MLTDFLVIIAGVAGMLFLAEVIIRNAVELARYFQLSGAFIGLTLLSVGTSIPELMSHVVGSYTILVQPQTMDAISGLLIGTNIGSDIFQQNFILPVVALAGTLVVARKRLPIEMGGLLGAALLAWVFGLDGLVSRLEGLMLVLAYMGYLLYLYRSGGFRQDLREPRVGGRRAALYSFMVIILSFVIMAVVTEHVVTASVEIVEELPISASFFGVVFLGITTSLPELTTALVSVLRGRGDISAGILIGSNITNPLLGIGAGALISRYTVPDVVVFYDLPINIATAVLLYIFLFRHEGLVKREAFILLLLFFAYLFARWIWFPEDFPSLS